MRLKDFVEKYQLKVVTAGELPEREVAGCYIGDLLSWVMSKARKDNVWITVQTNANIVAVASLTDAACVIVSEGIEIEESTVRKAEMQDVVLLSSPKTSYEIAKEICADI